ncbi:Uncharacterized protein dnm_038610 [Desulfonema magnum]|uniref:Uncharacterized protein n=1 Tax=Desulfonema magnum TaxID=45655 RepID=A0A975GNJ2_9BACT|nr:Uncharacterized protein dnm_038610 [Desulfonema magnum]
MNFELSSFVRTIKNLSNPKIRSLVRPRAHLLKEKFGRY